MAPGLLRRGSSTRENSWSNTSGNSVAPSPIDSQDVDPIPRSYDEPLAIVGMAFKLPQEASTEEGLWNILLNKRNTMTEYPKDRVNIDAFYHPDRSRSDTLPFRGGHFLDEFPSGFDAPFFSITAAEAEAMDPQQRLVLETAFHALENAGIPMDRIAGSKTSVHAGSFSDDYRTIELREPEHYPSYACSGIAQTMLSNRVSWFFNLQGASVTVDTACSSSMTALDISCQGLRTHEADTGLVVGSNLMLGLELSLTLSNMNFLSPDSKCYSFDHRANGYGRGEGVSVLVIKRLSTALEAGDTIRAVIRATGSGQDGWTPGITQPSVIAQEKLMTATYAKLGLDMGVTRYVEAHGTGTAVGDPIEATAIGNAFREYRNKSAPMYIGSIKSNLGHLEGCSGLAGIIKTVMMLEKGILAPNANFEKLNPAIDVDRLNLQVVTEPIPWPTRGLRRASISSFGIGGANVHVVLDDAYNYLRLHGLQGNHCTIPAPPGRDLLPTPSSPTFDDPYSNPRATASARPKKLLIFSAADQGGIDRIIDKFSQFASELPHNPGTTDEAGFLTNLAYTLHHRRSTLSWRSFAVVESISELVQLADRISKPAKRLATAKLAYAFTGQGAQYAKMAEGMLRFPVFLNSLRRSEMYFDQLGCSWSLFDELAKPSESTRINEPLLSQPLCTAIQIGIVDLLQHLGLSPSVVFGHSSGEIAAAYAIGAIAHESACRVAYYRGVCADELLHTEPSCATSSGMMAVGVPYQDIGPHLDRLNTEFGSPEVVVACINSPTNVTLSGDVEQLEWLRQNFDKSNIFARRLRVSIAYHSPQMQKVAGKYMQLLGYLKAGYCEATPPSMVSSVTGNVVSIEELRNGQYWVDNMVLPVRFSDAVVAAYHVSGSKSKASVRRAAFNDIVEIGPHSTLRGPILESLRNCGGTNVTYLSAQNRAISGEDAMLELVGHLFCRGHQILASAINDDRQLKTHDRVALQNLPKYPFDHSRRYWRETRAGKQGYRLRQHPRLDLLGTPCPQWNPLEPRWTCFLRVEEQPWIADHKIKGSILYPASGMVAMALEGAKQMVPDGRKVSGYTVRDTTFMRPIIVSADEQREVEIVLKSSKTASQKHSTTWDFTIYALGNDDEWQEKCNGVVSTQYERPVDSVDDGKETLARRSRDKTLLDSIQQSCTTTVDPRQFYKALEDKDFVYGPHFQAVTNINANSEDTAYADIKTFEWPNQEKGDFRQDHVIHPTTLDAMVQTCFVAGARGDLSNVPAMIPSRLHRLWIRSEGASHPALGSTRICMRTQSTKHKFMNEAFVVEPSTGETILSMDFECVSIDASNSNEAGPQTTELLCHELQWLPDLDLMDSATLSSYCNAVRPKRLVDVDYYENTDLLVMAYLIDIVQSIPEAKLTNMSSPLQRYVNWALDCKRRFEAGHLNHCIPSSKAWQDISSNTELRDALMERLKAKSDLGYLFAEVASNLPSILNGDIDAVQFMFGDDKLEKFYRAINDQVVCFEPLACFFNLLTHKNPSVKILEIGAGTGGSTVRLLDMLNAAGGSPIKLEHYDYTDISPAFFDKAAEVLAEHSSYMDFRILDIEKDPEEQGFETGTYDVVFAANVLHATKNIDDTLRNARKLLKPGGRLIMLEIVQETIRVGFAFGLFPSWWLGEEDHRVLHPWLRTPQWHEAMQRTGFSGVDLEIADFENQAYHEFSLIVATAVEDSDSSRLSPPICIMISDGSIEQEAVSEALKTELINKGYSCEVQMVHQLANLDLVQEGHWISLCELDQPVLSELDPQEFQALKQLILSARALFWVTGGGGDAESDPKLHMVDGLVRTLGTESPKLAFAALALQHGGSAPSSLAKKISSIFQNFLESRNDDAGESEYLEQQGLICTHRVVPSPQQQEDVTSRKRIARSTSQPFGSHPALALAIGSTGLLDTIHFVEDTEHAKPLSPGTVEVKIDTGGVNFRDCLTALGQLEADYIGCEYAGVVSRVPGVGGDDKICPFKPGDRVAGWCKGSYQTFTRNPAELITPVPDGLSLTDAAASLVVFSTAWHSLVNVARLARGESVLIHSAAGGTGQAAIQVARYLGAEVFVTAGSVEKKRFLMQTYDIPEERVFASRDLSFASGVLRETKGRGVDVILNSLSGESLLASWECIATCGRFVEIGNRDIMERAHLPMWPFRKAASFTHVALYVMVDEQPKLLMEVGRTILDLLAKKVFFVPQPLKVFSISEVQDIFRIFQNGNHYGRMVVQMRPDEIVETRVKPSERYRFDPSRTYLITGGLGGLGRSISLWMAERGARNLILLSRSGAKTESAQDLLRQLSAANVNVRAPECDICDRAALSRVIADCASDLPPIAGCIQAAMVLRDVLFENMSFEAWETACRPKVQGSWNLHSVLPSGLDFFTCLSSISCIVGNFGQANYAAGNSYMDELVRHRVSRGERATTINLGWVEKEGTVAENFDLKVTFAKIESTPPISMEELYALLDFACDPSKPMSPHQVISGLAPPKTASKDSIALEVPWLQKPSFRPFIHAAMHAGGQEKTNTAESATDFAARFVSATSSEDAVQVVCQCMKSRLSKALATKDDEIDMSLPLHAIGVDSLFGIELKNYLAKQFDADIAVFDLMGATSAEAACLMIANRSKLQGKK